MIYVVISKLLFGLLIDGLEFNVPEMKNCSYDPPDVVLLWLLNIHFIQATTISQIRIPPHFLEILFIFLGHHLSTSLQVLELFRGLKPKSLLQLGLAGEQLVKNMVVPVLLAYLNDP
jgi:hypothetical protein